MTDTLRASGARAAAPGHSRWPAPGGFRWPAPSGFRWPAEWEPHAATWLSWPHNTETWPGRLQRVEDAFVRMVEALAPHERVRINTLDDAMQERVGRTLQASGVGVERAVDLYRIATDDAWVRDHGPICVVRDADAQRERLLLDFRFDAWGGKYPPWDRDDRVPRALAETLGLERLELDFVLEGGSIDGDGRGTLLTTEACLLNPNRGSGRTRDRVEAVLADTLGARRIVWLADGIAGDDTDGHVDDFARFVGPGTVVAAVEPDASDANHVPLQTSWERLRETRNADGRPLEVIALPMPAPVSIDGVRCPASYANFYLANGVALVPVFDDPSDARALSILAECLPGREIVPIPARDLVVGLGGVHCLTQQEPASEVDDTPNRDGRTSHGPGREEDNEEAERTG